MLCVEAPGLGTPCCASSGVRGLNLWSVTSTIVCNLGVMFHKDLSLMSRVNHLTVRCYSCLRRIKSCRHALTRSTAVTVVTSKQSHHHEATNHYGIHVRR